MASIEPIQSLWRAHAKARFPEGCAGFEVEGIDLVLLDTFTTGCVQTFMERGNLDLGRTAILGLCYGDLVVVARALEDEAQAYFRRLELLARRVLEAVRDVVPEA